MVTPKNSIQLRVWGKYALFTDPINKIGGEKCSYHIPTYEAIKGVVKSIYWKPTLIWHIDKIRVIKPIKTQTKGVKPIKLSGGNDLSIYTYLVDVEYQILAHFEWNLYRPELESDRIDGKHYQIALRSLEKGGRQDIFLGTRECQAYVKPCDFETGNGAYDEIDELAFGLMFHSFGYPDETGKSELIVRLWKPIMKKGIIEFPRVDDPSLISKTIRPMMAKKFIISHNHQVVDQEITRYEYNFKSV